MILNDKQIKLLAEENQMISPYFFSLVSREIDPLRPDGRAVISYGQSSFGYDARAADEFLVFTNLNNVIVDPKAFSENTFVRISGRGYCIIPPNSFALTRTIEYFKVPRDVQVICLGKSSYARCGLVINVTPLEPEWEGHVTIEISNTTPLPAKVYANEGIAQFVFLQGEEPLVSYADRKGKYQGQTGITPVRC